MRQMLPSLPAAGAVRLKVYRQVYPARHFVPPVRDTILFFDIGDPQATEPPAEGQGHVNPTGQ